MKAKHELACGNGGDLRSQREQVVPTLAGHTLPPGSAAFNGTASHTPKALCQWKICTGDFCFLVCLTKASRRQQRELVNKPLGLFLLHRSEPGFVSGMQVDGTKKKKIAKILNRNISPRE